MAVKIRALILDMDGVLWRGPDPIGDLPAIFARLARAGLGVMMATNNATRTPEQYVARLKAYGVSVEPWQVINSAEATAAYLKNRFPQGGPVFVVGEEGLVQALAEQGFTQAEHNVLAVISAMDRGLTYDKLRQATLLIRGGVPYIATNPDRSFPTPQGEVPGAGAIVACLEAATGVSATIVGKPLPEMYRLALQRLGTNPTETLVVGDRLETDIAGAQSLGCPTGLVLSGVTTPEEAQAWTPPPTYTSPDLARMLDILHL